MRAPQARSCPEVASVGPAHSTPGTRTPPRVLAPGASPPRAPRPPPAPEVILASLPSNSCLAEASQGAGDDWTRRCWAGEHRTGWLGLCRTLLPRLDFCSTLLLHLTVGGFRGASASTGECSLTCCCGDP